MIARSERSWGLLAALAGTFILCAWTTDHYWDEYYYLFSVSRHSPGTLFSLEAALSDGIFPNGFFSGKLAFVFLLRGLISVFGSDPSGIVIARVLFAGMTLGIALATWLLVRAWVDDRSFASRASAILLLSPLATYLGFKLMSEVPALLAATLGGWQFVVAIRSDDARSRSRALALAAAAFGVGILLRLTCALFPVGLVAALLVAPPEKATRRHIVIDALIVVGGAGAVAAAVLLMTLDAPLARFSGLAHSVTGRNPGAVVVLYALALFCQLFVILLVAALRPFTKVAGAALAWLAIAMLPYVVTAQYVEPRFFYTGLPAFAILGAAGIQRLVSLAPYARRSMFAATMVVAMALLDRVLFAGLMPYEIRESDYSALVDDVSATQPVATLVTPWLSDFCYLSTALPERRVVLAMSETYGTGAIFRTPEFQRWVGAESYAGSAADLEVLPRPRIYVGWHYSPTVEALDRYLRPLNLAYLDDPERRARLLDHLTPSWLWRSPQYRLEPVASRGAYRAFQILDRDAR